MIQKLNEASIATMTMPAGQARLKEIGADVVAPERRSPDFLRVFVDSEIAKWAGAIRAAGVAGESSEALAAYAPTFAEEGVGGYESELWFGLIAPAGTPPALVARINRDVARIVQSPEMRQRFAVQGARPIGSTPEEFAQFLGQEQTKWSRVIKEANIKPE